MYIVCLPPMKMLYPGVCSSCHGPSWATSDYSMLSSGLTNFPAASAAEHAPGSVRSLRICVCVALFRLPSCRAAKVLHFRKE